MTADEIAADFDISRATFYRELAKARAAAAASYSTAPSPTTRQGAVHPAGETVTTEKPTGICRGCHQERLLTQDGKVWHHEVAPYGDCDGSSHYPLGPNPIGCTWTATYRVEGRNHSRIPYYNDRGTYALHGTLSEAYTEAEPHIRAHLAELNNTTPHKIHISSFTIHPVTNQVQEDPYGVYTKPVPEYTIRKGPRGDKGTAAHSF